MKSIKWLALLIMSIMILISTAVSANANKIEKRTQATADSSKDKAQSMPQQRSDQQYFDFILNNLCIIEVTAFFIKYRVWYSNDNKLANGEWWMKDSPENIILSGDDNVYGYYISFDPPYGNSSKTFFKSWRMSDPTNEKYTTRLVRYYDIKNDSPDCDIKDGVSLWEYWSKTWKFKPLF